MRFTDERSKYGRYVPAIVFLLFVYGLGAWFLFAPKLEYSSQEKRYLEQFPTVSVDTVASGEFGAGFEKFFADQFPVRNFWVGTNAYYALDTGNNGANGVYKCGNDYLINKPVSTDNKLQKNVEAIANFAAVTNVPITVMFAPSTGYIADDVLPTFHDKYNDDMYFDDVKKAFDGAGIGFVDLRNRFKNEYKNGTQLYYKTDHHWTTAGAYTAYTELCRTLGITPTDKNSFDVKSYPNFYGTTYSTSGFWFNPPDCIEVWSNPQNTKQNIKVKITEGTNTLEYDSMYFYNHIKEDDKYPVFLDGNHALTEITNSKAKGGTVLLIKDSFSHSLAPFLADNYSKVVLVDMRYYKMNVSELVKKENPEHIVVLYGIDNIATDTDLVWLS